MDKICRRDAFSLLPYDKIENDKQYTNIAEFFLKENNAATDILCQSKIEYENLSDYEFLRTFIEVCFEKDKINSYAFSCFEKCVSKLVPNLKISIENIDEIWTKTSEALLNSENSLKHLIEKSNYEEIGFRVDIKDAEKDFIEQIGNTRLSPVLCPFHDENIEEYSYDEFSNLLEKDISKFKKCAVFLRDFNFEKPNEYSAKNTWNKILKNTKVSYEEKDLLKTQILRNIIKATAENQGILYVFLPGAKQINSMPEVMKMLEYTQDCNFNRFKAVFFAEDLLSMTFAMSILSKNYKKTDAEIGIVDNGIINMNSVLAEHMGLGKKDNLYFASLCKTACYL